MCVPIATKSFDYELRFRADRGGDTHQRTWSGDKFADAFKAIKEFWTQHDDGWQVTVTLEISPFARDHLSVSPPARP